jgi:hypothetical protein
MYSLDEDKIPESLPERAPLKPLPNDVEARQQAYYAAYSASKKSLIGRARLTAQEQQKEFLNLYGKIHNDLVTNGVSQDMEDEKTAIINRDAQDEQQDIINIATDPTIPVEQRANVLTNKPKNPFNWADKYKTTITAENHGVTKKDELAQDKNVATYIPKNIQAAKDVEDLKNAAAGSLNITHAGFAGSALLNFIPGRTGVLTANLYAAMTNDHSFTTRAKNIVLPGSANKEMGKLWQQWDAKEKREGLIRIIRYMESSTALDADKVEMLLKTLENPDQPWWETSLSNISGILDATFVGAAAKSPIKSAKEFIKWATTYNAAGDKAAVSFVKNVFTKKNVAAAGATTKAAQEVATDATIIQAVTKNEPPVTSPLGIEVINNPDKASKTIVASVLDDTGEVAKVVTPEGKGQIVDVVLPKSVDSGELQTMYPDVFEKINTYAKALKPESQINPALYDDAFQQSEINTHIEIIKRTQYPSLQLSNTVVDFRFGDTSYIKAMYGETPNRGWLTEGEAMSMLNKLKGDIPPDVYKNMEVTYHPKNNEYYITHNIEKQFTPNVLMGDDYGATFQIPYTKKEISLDAIARNKYINWILPSSSRMTSGLSSSAIATEMGVAQNISKLNQYLNNFVMNKTDVFPDLNKELKLIHEQQISGWKSVKELLADKPHLSEAQKKDLVEAYYSVKALGDTFYDMANKRHRGDLVLDGQKAIYGSDGSIKGFGKDVPFDETTHKYIFDIDLNAAVVLTKETLAGGKIVKLKSLLSDANGDKWEYAILRGGSKLGELPPNTLSRIDNYIPWYHTADFFVQRTPLKMRLNGLSVSDESTLAKFSERIAGARTHADADKIVAEMTAEFGDTYTFKTVLRSENVLDEIVNVHEEATKYAAWEKHRGQRLLNYDPIDDPIRSLHMMGKSLMQLDAWEDFNRYFKQRFEKTYADILPEGQIPKNPDRWTLPDGKNTKENIALLAAGKRELEWHNGIFRSMVESDRAVSSFFHSTADVMNQYGIKGDKAVRDLAKQGNVFLRIPNAAATHLLLYNNIAKQWVVQTQNIWSLHALDPAFIRYGLPNVLPFIFATLGKSKYFQGQESTFIKISKFIGETLSGIKGKEWDDMYNGFANSGMLQAVDLNQMVLGLKHHGNYTLTPEVHEQIAKGLTQAISLPGNIAKNLGYTPAELTNLAGAWIYSYKQYQKLHPGVDMTNLHHIEQVKAKALALTGSMAGSADTMSYQRGMWSLLFKFMPIQSKQLALMTTSKATTKEEKIRLAVGQTILWGTAGTLGGTLIHDGVNAWMTDEEKEVFNKYEGGLIDLVFNNILDITLRHAFGIDDEKPTSIGWSHSMGPFNNGYGVPAIDVFYSLYKTFTDQEAANPRIAAVGATGVITNFITSISNRLAIQGEYDTPHIANAIIAETPTLFKAWDNAAKGYVMWQTGKLVSKHGNPRDLVASHGDAIGRMAGVYTKEELDAFKNIDVEKGKKAAQKAMEKEVFDYIMKNRTDILFLGRTDRAVELDKMLYVLGHDDPELMSKMRTSIEKKLFYANKEFADSLQQQIDNKMSEAKASLDQAEAEVSDGALKELIQTLRNK